MTIFARFNSMTIDYRQLLIYMTVAKCGHVRLKKCEWLDSAFPDISRKVKSRYIQLLESADLRDLPVHISIRDYDKLIKQPCIYCGSEVLEGSGIDRVDNKKSYEIDNAAVCCGTCNIMKNRLSVAKFLDQADRIAARRKIIEGYQQGLKEQASGTATPIPEDLANDTQEKVFKKLLSRSYK